MTDIPDDNTPNSSFELQDALTAFDQFSSTEIERLQQTQPEFDLEQHERARRLVLSRLESLQNPDTDDSKRS